MNLSRTGSHESGNAVKPCRLDRIGEELAALGPYVEELRGRIGALRATGNDAEARALHARAVCEAGRTLVILDLARTDVRRRARAEEHWGDVMGSVVYAFMTSSSPSTVGEARREVRRLLGAPHPGEPYDPELSVWREFLRSCLEGHHEGPVPTPEPAPHMPGTTGRSWPGSQVIELVSAMHRLGLLGMAGAFAAARVWTPVTITDGISWEAAWYRNAEVLEQAVPEPRLSAEELAGAVRAVLDDWTFPLLGIDLPGASPAAPARATKDGVWFRRRRTT
ncbi:hypothetical protein [Sinomonas mesophila]|uniref:hypothetical protein n=1 Tax=Sinomonas mesophila TaxID=1531955 RepID=UPI00098580A8|nr:hypothetical protein [Sinomonas mesophila]